MKRIEFCKFHGFGNDYLIFEAEQLKGVSDAGDFAARVCDRHLAIGGDGIAVLEKLAFEAADYSCRIINPDGSEAGFSGNGTRCAVAYLHFKNLWQARHLKLQTKSGIKNYELLNRENNSFQFLAELGKPKFAADEIPFVTEQTLSSIKDYDLQITNLSVPVTALNVGNPVAVVFVKDFDLNWQAIGAEIETHQRFPERTNVVFVQINDSKNIEIRIWERGAGETSSSGTCSIAAAVASAFTGKTDRKVSVHAPGGTTEAVWRETDDEMLITGRADLAFCGEWLENSNEE